MAITEDTQQKSANERWGQPARAKSEPPPPAPVEMREAKPKGFRAMSAEDARRVRSLGGKARAAQHVGHSWNRDEAIAASRKGAAVRAARAKATKSSEQSGNDEAESC